MRRSNWVSLVHDNLEVCLRLSSSDWLLIDKHVSDGRMDGAKVLQQCSLAKGSLFNGKYTEAELYPGTTIAFSREIEKTDAKNARGLRGEKALAPFLRSREFYFPLHWPCFRDVPTGWRACHGRGQRRLSVIACFPQSGVPSYAIPGAPNDNFRNTSVDSDRKTNWDLEFSEHLLFSCLS